jgi:uncharacterized protein YprB with RNaseH-like and TPR domain
MSLVNRCVAAWRDRSVSIDPPHPELAAFRDCFPRDVLFLDLETSGFAGSTIFLAGLVHATDSGLSLSQLWARNYTEEPAVLHTLWQIAATASVLVTFNGKSFDWPQVRDRSILHRVGGVWARDARVLVHCDLLHHARRLWKHQLPDCRLQTLERLICRRRRTGDIAGRDIPQVYHDYVRRGDTTLVRSILHHNSVDLVTLVQLSLHIVRPDSWAHVR